jgi:hypothetical protein
MSSSTEVGLSDLAQRALGMSRDRRAYPGDLRLRVGVQGRPSPEDVVQLLDAAASGQSCGLCRDPLGASRLLARLSTQPWQAEVGERSSLACTLAVELPQGAVKLVIRRHPEPHVWSVG